MKNKWFVLIILLIIILPVSGCFIQYQWFLYQRHHLLCEVLKPGMSKDEVLGILKQAGNFTMNYAESSNGNFEIGINYTDLKGSNMYGAFDLGFRDYKYNLPYVRHGSDNSEDICNFPITLSITGTPKQ